jgi:hypothetical protein
MDGIFQQATNVFDVVRLARPDVTPNKYDKHGKFIMSDDEDSETTGSGRGIHGSGEVGLENKGRSGHNEAYQAEGGFAGKSEKEGL